MKPSLIFIVALAAFFLIRKSCDAQELQIPAARDNTIYSEGDSSNARGTFLFSGFTATGNKRRGLLKFDLRQFQANDSVVSATLNLYVSRTIGGEFPVLLYRMKKDWGEGNSDAKFEEGGGATATPGDATWNYAFFDTAQWTAPGGDYEVNPSASCLVGGIGTYTWTGDTVALDVRKWIHQPDSNFGWIVVGREDIQSSKRFNSRENAEFGPQLIVSTVRPNSLTDAQSGMFSLYPNPSSGIVYIYSNEPGMLTVRLYDLTGRELSGNQLRFTQVSPGLFSFSLNLKGIYLIKLNQYFRKIIIL